jgi:hypothetical protein
MLIIRNNVPSAGLPEKIECRSIHFFPAARGAKQSGSAGQNRATPSRTNEYHENNKKGADTKRALLALNKRMSPNTGRYFGNYGT